MKLYLSRFPQGWLIHDQDKNQYLAVDGRLTKFPDKAYVSSSFQNAANLFTRASHNDWSLYNGNFTNCRLPNFNDPTIADKHVQDFITETVIALGDGIFCVNIYNNVKLNKQEVMDQINIIAGNPRNDTPGLVTIKIDNKKLFSNYFKYLQIQVDGELITGKEDFSPTISKFIIQIIDLDMMIREEVSLNPESCMVLASHITGPIFGNRAEVDNNTWLLGMKQVILSICKSWRI